MRPRIVDSTNGYIHSHRTQFREEIQEALNLDDQLGQHEAEAASQHLLRWQRSVRTMFASCRRTALQGKITGKRPISVP